MDSTPDRIRIHYRRLPDREEIFDQRLLERRPDCVVTFLESTAAREPLVIGGRTTLETGSPIIWFTFPGAWHDIGRVAFLLLWLAIAAIVLAEVIVMFRLGQNRTRAVLWLALVALASPAADPIVQALLTARVVRAVRLRKEFTEEVGRQVFSGRGIRFVVAVSVLGMFGLGWLFSAVETTQLTRSEQPHSFESATRAATELITHQLPDVQALIDVAAARAAGVAPVPTRRTVNGVVEIDAGPALLPPTQQAQPAPPSATEPGAADSPASAAPTASTAANQDGDDAG